MISNNFSYHPILPLTDDIKESFKKPISQKMTPQKYYPIKDMKVQLTPSAKNQRNLIYVFKDLTNGMKYNGLTKQNLTHRNYQHLHKAKLVQSGKEKGTKFHRALAIRPEQFVVGIYPLDTTQKSLGRLEKEVIRQKDSVRNGYNSNSGGAEGPKKTPVNKQLFV